MFWDILTDTSADSVRLLPFLFAAFCMMEALEKYSESFGGRILGKIKGVGPILGALLGCIPQCGFSVLAANLFAGGMISAGTLLAVFLSTSDEAILILMGNPDRAGEIGKLIAVKVLIALTAGYVLDIFFRKSFSEKKEIHEVCRRSGCGCEEEGVLKPAWRHTVKLFAYLFVFTLSLNLLLELVGIERVESLLLGGSAAQVFLTAAVGFIPNCAASVLLAELYLKGVISFAAVTAGLCTSAGVGLVVLMRLNQNKKENVKILAALYITAAAAGLALSGL